MICPGCRGPVGHESRSYHDGDWWHLACYLKARHLLVCGMCGGPFHVPFAWWVHAGRPELDCPACNPHAYDEPSDHRA